MEVGQVFSVEPGIYIEGTGGVRIENLCTVVEDPENQAFLRVRPMTFSPFDDRLIDKKQLTPQEKKFLLWFKQRFAGNEGLEGPLPPLE